MKIFGIYVKYIEKHNGTKRKKKLISHQHLFNDNNNNLHEGRKLVENVVDNWQLVSHKCAYIKVLFKKVYFFIYAQKKKTYKKYVIATRDLIIQIILCVCVCVSKCMHMQNSVGSFCCKFSFLFHTNVHTHTHTNIFHPILSYL